MDLGSVHFYMACSDLSRPKPDCMYPPMGLTHPEVTPPAAST